MDNRTQSAPANHVAADAQAGVYPPLNTSQWWGLFAVLVMAALLRLHELGDDSLWSDETLTLSFSRFVDMHGGLLEARNVSEAPLMAVLTWLWHGAVQATTNLSPLSQANDFLIRLLPCAFSVWGVYMVYGVTRVATRDNGAALAAAFLCAISPFQVHYAQELRVYSIYMAFSLLLLYCLVRALEEDRARWWAGVAAMEALLLYTHFTSVWTIFLVNVFFVLGLAFNVWTCRKRFIKWYGAQAVAFVLSLPAIALFLRAYGFMQQIEIAWYHFDLGFKTGLITFKTFFAGYGPTVWAYWGIFAIAGFLTLMGVASMRKRPGPLVLTLMLVAGPIALNILLWREREFAMYHQRMFIFSGAMAFVLAGAGLRALRHPVAVGLVASAMLAFTTPALLDHYARRLHPLEVHRAGIYVHSDFRAAARYIESEWREGDALTAANSFVTTPLWHYLGRFPLRLSTEEWERDLMIRSHGQDALLFRHHMMPRMAPIALRSYDRVWFVVSKGISFEYQPHTRAVRDWLDAHYTAIEDREFHGLRVTLYAKPTENNNEGTGT